METIVIVLHVLVALVIIGLILIQQGKGADAGASFGAGASQTVFGSSGSGNVLTRSTSILAFLFFATSFGLAIYAKERAGSVNQLDVPVVAPVEGGDMPAADTALDGAEDIPSMDAEPSVDDIPELDAGADAGAADIPESVPES